MAQILAALSVRAVAPACASNFAYSRLIVIFSSLSTAKYTSSEQRSAPFAAPGSTGPSPTNLPSVSDQSHPQAEYFGGDASSYTSHEPHPMSEASAPQASAQRPPSPRRSMFDFVSPFDALNSSNTSQQPKRKPIPPQPSSNAGSNNEDSWGSLSLDPKRKSVENLMDQITMGQVSHPPPQSVSGAGQFESYTQNEEATTPTDFSGSRASRPLPPHPGQQGPNSSPRASPPKPAVQQPQLQPQQQRQQTGRSVESPIGPPGNQGQFQMHRRDKEGSPVPTGLRHLLGDVRSKGTSPRGKNNSR